MKNLAMGLLLLSSCGATTRSGVDPGSQTATDDADAAGGSAAPAHNEAGSNSGGAAATAGASPVSPNAGIGGAVVPSMGGNATVSESGAGPTGPRCDYIKECKDAAQSCAAVLGNQCGAVSIGSFSCGAVTGFYFSDGVSFPCIQGSVGLDCSGASAGAAQRCSAAAESAAGGGSAQGGSSGAPGAGEVPPAAGSAGAPAQCSVETFANVGCTDWALQTSSFGSYYARSCSCTPGNSCAGSDVQLSPPPTVGAALRGFKCASCSDCAAAAQAAFNYGNGK